MALLGLPADALDLEDLAFFSDAPSSWYHWGLWDILCDRDAGGAPAIPFKASSGLDFSSPENLLTWLVGSDEARRRFPLLHAALEARKGKRETISIDGEAYARRKAEKGAAWFGNLEEVLRFPTTLTPEELGGILRWPSQW